VASNIVLIAAEEGQSAAEAAGPGAEEKIKAAMTATAGHWLATSEDDQFLAACEGAARCLDEGDRERIEASLKVLQGLAAAASGVPVDFAALIPEDSEDEPMPKPFPLKKWWNEVKEPNHV
jgi:hypothetical protein